MEKIYLGMKFRSDNDLDFFGIYFDTPPKGDYFKLSLADYRYALLSGFLVSDDEFTLLLELTLAEWVFLSNFFVLSHTFKHLYHMGGPFLNKAVRDFALKSNIFIPNKGSLHPDVILKYATPQLGVRHNSIMTSFLRRHSLPKYILTFWKVKVEDNLDEESLLAMYQKPFMTSVANQLYEELDNKEENEEEEKLQKLFNKAHFYFLLLSWYLGTAYFNKNFDLVETITRFMVASVVKYGEFSLEDTKSNFFILDKRSSVVFVSIFSWYNDFYLEGNKILKPNASSHGLKEAQVTIASLQEEIARMKEQHQQDLDLLLDAVNTLNKRSYLEESKTSTSLSGLKILVIGDENRQRFYRALVEASGAEFSFLQGFDNNSRLDSALKGADGVIMLTAYCEHVKYYHLKSTVDLNRVVFVHNTGVSSFNSGLEALRVRLLEESSSYSSVSQ